MRPRVFTSFSLPDAGYITHERMNLGYAPDLSSRLDKR